MNGRLLIAGDLATNGTIIQDVLYDYAVITAKNRQDAIRLIRQQADIDLLVLDLHTPVQDGIQVYHELKDISRNKYLRAMILTDACEPGDKNRRPQTGAVETICKPLHPEFLRLHIGMHMELVRIQKLYEKTLHERRITFDALLEQAPIGIALSHSEYSGRGDEARIIFNNEFQRMTGRTREELITAGWEKVTHPDDIIKEEPLFQRFRAGEIDGYQLEKRFVRPDGGIVWVELIVSQLDVRTDMEFNHLCLVLDITERKAMEDALWESERSKSVLLGNLPGLAYRCDYDRNWTMRFISEGCHELTGYHPESLLHNRDLAFNDIIAPEYREYLWTQWGYELKKRASVRHEYEIITASGQRKWVLEMGQGIFDDDGNVQALEGIIIDINDRKVNELQIKHISEIDSLTKLHNRRYLENLLKNKANEKGDGESAVVLLSLRKINSISLAYGYHFCEQLIVELANKLAALENENRQLFQISFERYAFYVTKYKSDADLRTFSREVLELVNSQQILRTVGCGVGIAHFTCTTCEAENIIRNASTAAERSDRDQYFGYRFFNREMEAAMKREADVKEALARFIDGSEDDRLYLQFQPILNLKTNSVEEFEALARFEGKSIGKVSPTEFISIAEETQLIVPIGRKIMEMACAFQKRLQDSGFQNIRVCVNASAIQLLRSDFLSDSMRIAAQYGVKPECFGLEVTESAFAENFDAINEMLASLMAFGVKTSIDDFGTGYSSLARERDMKINVLKIDKYFIDGLLEIEREKTVTQDIITMAHRMGHAVVAEGVEYEEQMQYLKDFDCDMIQGYLFSKPLDADEAIRFITEQS